MPSTRRSSTAELPTGTVTFLFTDIEGSTRLVQQLEDAWPEILEAHGAIIRSAVREHGGIDIRTEGDAFFCVFTSAPAALAAAVAAQRGLHDHPWPPGREVRVRMGLHTGEGRFGGDDYVGLEVHRAARVAATGHGGQIVLSSATRPLVEQSLPSDVSIRELGGHRLKDLPELEELFDVVVADLPCDFPPLSTLDVAPNNLPVQLTSFIARPEELGRVTEAIETARLVTLTGPGGTGKTRLSVEVAAGQISRFPGGVFFVALDGVSDPELVPSAIADALGITHIPGPPLDTVIAHLTGSRTLIVLDNFEQVLEAGVAVSKILQSSRDVHMIVTSRAPLRVSGEHEIPIPPLATPRMPEATIAELAAVPSVRLFVDRAMAVRPEFRLTAENMAAVTQIVDRLEGLPLAVELAAARTRVLEPVAIAERLRDPLTLLSSGARDLPRRQQTLRAAIEWSYDLLDADLKALFRATSVFVGGFSLDEAERVARDAIAADLDPFEGIAALVDQSLVHRADGRFKMLETIRELGAEKLTEAGEEEDVRRRHARAYLELVERARPHLTGWDQARWHERLAADHDNIRRAIRWSLDAGEMETAQRLLACLWRFWQIRGHLHEGRAWAREILSRPGGSPSCRAAALEAAGGIAYWQNDRDEAISLYRQGLDLARGVGDQARIAELAYDLGFVLAYGPDQDEGRPLLDEALAIYRSLGDRNGAARVLWGIADSEYFIGNYDRARELVAESADLFRQVDDPFGLSWALYMQGLIGVALDPYGEGIDRLAEALEIFRRLGDVSGYVLGLGGFAAAASRRGLHERALRLMGAVARLRDVSGTDLVTFNLEGLASIQASIDALDDETRTRLLQEGHAMTVDEAVGYALERE